MYLVFAAAAVAHDEVAFAKMNSILTQIAEKFN
jgi:hypothetical protein